MAHDMPPQLTVQRLPPPKGPGIRCDPRIHPPAVQKLLTVKVQQHSSVTYHILFETAVQQLDILQVETIYFEMSSLLLGLSFGVLPRVLRRRNVLQQQYREEASYPT